MSELIFMVEEDIEGGYVAQALGQSIVTQGDTIEELKTMIKDAILCHYDDPNDAPRIVRLHFVREEVFALN